MTLLTLISQLFATLGCPLPAPTLREKDASRPYPCQNRPCGCLTYEQCWAGDCCCFTLEEKVAWADENGIEPPAHVRPLIESRRTRSVPAKIKTKSCCSKDTPVAEASVPACCNHPKSAATACCHEVPTCEPQPLADCDRCETKSKANCYEKKTPPITKSEVRWVIGGFAQRCRGQGPVGLFQLDLVLFSDVASIVLPDPDCDSYLPPVSLSPTSLTYRPPTPPPRFC